MVATNVSGYATKVVISSEAVNFLEQPESFEPLYIAWKNRYE
jgi:hypothetical protein